MIRLFFVFFLFLIFYSCNIVGIYNYNNKKCVDDSTYQKIDTTAIYVYCEYIKPQNPISNDSIIRTINKGNITILNKKAAYIYNNKQVPRRKIKTTSSLFYPIRYVLIAENYKAKKCTYDYVFYVYDSHQDQLIDNKLIQKKLKKIKKCLE